MFNFSRISNPEYRKVLEDYDGKVGEKFGHFRKDMNVNLMITFGFLAILIIASVVFVMLHVSENDKLISLDNRVFRVEKAVDTLEDGAKDTSETLGDFEERLDALENQQLLFVEAGDVEPSQPENCVPKNEVTSYRYLPEDSVPIPVGESVEVFPICDGNLGLKWEERIGIGKVTHLFYFDDVELSYRYYNESLSERTRYAVSGDMGTVERYSNVHGALETDSIGSDDIVDGIRIHQVREFDETDVALMELSDQFYAEAIRDNWFYMLINPESTPSGFLMDGKPLQKGPYGKTYMVPESGGTLTAYFEAGSLSWTNQYFVAWEIEVSPGDEVLEGFLGTMKAEEPGDLCRAISYMRPSWQPAEELPREVEGACENLWSQQDKSPLALLAREGFLKARSGFSNNGKDMPKDWVPFVFLGSGYDVNFSWPAHHWKHAPALWLDEGDVYSVQLHRESETPIIYRMDDGFPEGVYYDADISGYQDWGDPIVFYPKDKMNTGDFQWELARVFRLKLSADKQKVLVEEMIIAE